MIVNLENKKPKIAKDVFVADNARVIGNVEIGEKSSVWFGAVVRGDDNTIKIGERTNIQDLCMVHIDHNHDTIIGDDVTVGHRAIIHGAHIGNRCLIGMGAIIMNGAKIGDDCIVGAGALVTEDQIIPPKTLVIGFPAKPKRELTENEIKMILKSAHGYAKRAEFYKKNHVFLVDS